MNPERQVVSHDCKVCPICSQTLPIADFGICRARKDGRNLYCKTCIRQKVTASRRALKEYKTARKKYIAEAVDENHEFHPTEPNVESASAGYSRMVSRLTPGERVRDAIRRGARTQKEIAHETKLGKDEIGEALAHLMLWTNEVKSEVVDNTRVYLIKHGPDAQSQLDDDRIPPRKNDAMCSFAGLQGLMPGKNPEGDASKIGGWVAA